MAKTVNYDNGNQLPSKVYLNGKEYFGEVAFVDGFNGYTKSNGDGLMCALINKSAFTNKGKPNVVCDVNGNRIHSENRRRLVYSY